MAGQARQLCTSPRCCQPQDECRRRTRSSATCGPVLEPHRAAHRTTRPAPGQAKPPRRGSDSAGAADSPALQRHGCSRKRPSPRRPRSRQRPLLSTAAHAMAGRARPHHHPAGPQNRLGTAPDRTARRQGPPGPNPQSARKDASSASDASPHPPTPNARPPRGGLLRAGPRRTRDQPVKDKGAAQPTAIAAPRRLRPGPVPLPNHQPKKAGSGIGDDLHLSAAGFEGARGRAANRHE